MKSIIDNIISKDLLLKNIEVKEVFDIDDSDENKFLMKAKYKIVENDDDEANIKLRVEFGFEPQILCKGIMDFNLYIKFDKQVSEKEIKNNLPELIHQVGSEVSSLLSIIIKSMVGTAFVVPPIIGEIKEL